MPNEILEEIAAKLSGIEIFAVAKSCKNLYYRLQPAFLKYNIKYQNSNLLHLAVKTSNISLAEAMLDYHANVNTFSRGKTLIIRVLEYSSTDMLKLLLKTLGVDINL